MDFLQNVMLERKADVDSARGLVPQSQLERIAAVRVHHSLSDRLRIGPRPAIIAEMKKASPSAGLLRRTYEPEKTAELYEKSGAAAISILTEPRHFLGSDEHVRLVRRLVAIPVLRKDFICDPYQVYETAAMGADIILLIVAALGGRQLMELNEAARECRLDVLVESHTREEVEIALGVENAIIGINSRNLKTLKTDTRVALELVRSIPEGRLAVSESGIKTRRDIEAMQEAGFDGFLVGESLMSSDRPQDKLRELIGTSPRIGEMS
ncbi:MAG: indole-3-glycerol phosphate synthase TrpC [Verrucomicrobia bacterium]|nr:indole-3-glycerol phosphate synthase TrpC [Verrucomicrobiota bacterium]